MADFVFCKSFWDTNCATTLMPEFLDFFSSEIAVTKCSVTCTPPIICCCCLYFGDLPCSRARSGVGPSADTEVVGGFQRRAEASGCPYEAAASAGQPLRTRGPASSALFSTRRCSLSLPLPLRWRTTPRSRRSSGLRSRRAPSPRSRSSTRQLASRRAWPTSRCAAPLTHRTPPLGLLRASSNASARPARPPLERSRVLFATA